jgi:hypothetical protein
VHLRRALIFKIEDPDVPIVAVGHWITFRKEWEFPQDAKGVKILFYGENRRVIAEGRVIEGVLASACSSSNDRIEFEVQIISRLPSVEIRQMVLAHLGKYGWTRLD